MTHPDAALATGRHHHAVGFGASPSTAAAGRLRIVGAIVGGFMVVEIVAGLLTGSLALLADAGHMLTDVAGVGMALVAIHFAGRPATPSKTFGWYRLEILAAIGNGLLLLGVAGVVAWEAIARLGQPPVIAGGPVLLVASAGLLVNVIAVRLLHADQARSLNVRGAFLEVVGDLIGSAAVIVSSAVVLLTGLVVADVLASLLIAALIVPRTWALVRDAADVLLEAAPRDVDIAEVRRHILETPGVADAHDLHAWTVTSGMRVVSAHVVLDPEAIPANVLDALCRCLSDDFDFEHSTFQLETADRRRLELSGHA